MNKVRILVFIISAFFAHLATADEVTIRADEWYPFNGKPDTSRPGYMIELAETIMAEQGHSVDYQVLPWLGSLAMVKRGVFDCVVGTDKVEARDFIFAEEPWGKIKSTFYVNSGDRWHFDGLGSLNERRIGVIGSYSYGEAMDDFINRKRDTSVQIVNANNALRQNIGKLQGNLIDTVLAFDLVMDAKLNELNLTGQVVAAGDLEEGDFIYIACTPKKATSKVYAEYFSNGIQAMRNDGRLQILLDKYGVKDWK